MSTEPLRLHLDFATTDGPDTLAAVIPTLLGYVPAQSLCAVLVKDRRMLMTMRVDLPAPGAEDRALSALLCDDLRGAEAALLVAYVDDPTGPPCALEDAAAGLELLGLTVPCAMTVSGGRYWLSACQNPDLPRGRWLDLTPDHPAALEAALQVGGAPLPSRAALGALLDPDGRSPRVRAELDRLTAAQAWPTTAQAAQAWTQILTGSPDDLPDATLARAVATVAAAPDAVAHRDALIMTLIGDDLTGPIAGSARAFAAALPAIGEDDGGQLRDRLVALCRLTGTAAPVVYAIAGVVAWAHGHGTLAALCTHACLRRDPDHSLAQLLGALLDARVDPRGFGTPVAA